MQAATPQARYGPGRRSSVRSSGEIANAASTAAGISTAVYLELAPQPSAAPAAIHHPMATRLSARPWVGRPRRLSAGAATAAQCMIDRPQHHGGAREEGRIRSGEYEPDSGERYDGQQNGEPPGPPCPPRWLASAAAAQLPEEAGHDRARPHAEWGRAADHGARADQPGDDRWMIEVSGREMARPLPVVRLVGNERHERRHQKARRGGSGEQKERRLHRVSRATAPFRAPAPGASRHMESSTVAQSHAIHESRSGHDRVAVSCQNELHEKPWSAHGDRDPATKPARAGRGWPHGTRALDHVHRVAFVRPDAVLDALLERGRGEAAPAWDGHHAPRSGRAPPAVIVRPGHDRQVQAIRQRQNPGAVSVTVAQSARSGVGHFDGGDWNHARHPGPRNSGERTRNRLHDHGTRAPAGNGGFHSRGGEVAAAEQGVVGRPDTEHVHVLAAFEAFDCAEEDRSVAGTRWIGAHAGVRAGEGEVVRDVRDIEPGGMVPFPVPFRREPGAPVVRRARVAVKVDGDHVRVAGRQLDRRHWPGARGPRPRRLRPATGGRPPAAGPRALRWWPACLDWSGVAHVSL